MPDVYKKLFDLEEEFDLILTHDAEVLINFEHKQDLLQLIQLIHIQNIMV